MHHPVLRKRQQKPPSSDAVAAADLKALVTEYSSRYSSNLKNNCMHKPLQPQRARKSQPCTEFAHCTMLQISFQASVHRTVSSST
jgi:hypothetical protein